MAMECSSDRLTTSGGTPVAQYDAVSAAWIAAWSKRAGSELRR